jgi:uncharacterized peroxidase-related enzyme
MSRLPAIDPGTATGRTKELLDVAKVRFGRVPNLAKTMANSPAALGGWLGLSAGLDESVLSPALRQQIALTVSQLNGCRYGLAVHSAVGRLVGLCLQEIVAARHATATDAKTGAALKFAQTLVERRGHIGDADFSAVRAAGFSNSEIVEIIVQVAYDTLMNYVAIATQLDLDCRPEPELLDRAN